MNKSTKYLIVYSVVVTFVAVLMTHNTVKLIATETVEVINECESLESQVRGMSNDEANSLLSVVAEAMALNYKEETREQVELEHQRYADRLALEHINDAVGDMVESAIASK